MSTGQRSADSVYEEIARLSGKRATCEQLRYSWIKLKRATDALVADYQTVQDCPPDLQELADASRRVYTARRAELWSEIEKLDAEIDRLTRLVQNGAFNA